MFGFELENWNIQNWEIDYGNVHEFRSNPCKDITELKKQIQLCFMERLKSISRTEREPNNFVGFHVHFSKKMNEKVDFISYGKLYNILHAIHPLFFNSFDEETYSRRIHRGQWCRLRKIGNMQTYDSYHGRTYSILTPNSQTNTLTTLEFRLPDLPYHIDIFSILWNIYNKTVETKNNTNPNDYVLYEEKILNTSKDKIKVIPTPILPKTFGKDVWRLDKLIPNYLSAILGDEIITVRDNQFVQEDTHKIVKDIFKIQQNNADDFSNGKTLSRIGTENYNRITKEVQYG